MSAYKNMGRSGLIEEIKMLSESAEVVDIAFVSVMNENERLKAENEALRKDAERYRSLRKATPYRFKKMQDAALTDGGDVMYFHADRFDAAIDAAMAQGEQS